MITLANVSYELTIPSSYYKHYTAVQMQFKDVKMKQRKCYDFIKFNYSFTGRGYGTKQRFWWKPCTIMLSQDLWVSNFYSLVTTLIPFSSVQGCAPEDRF